MSRGANVPLTREIPGLKHLVIGVAWNAGAEPVLQDNLVMAAILCNESNKALSAEHFVFFNQLTSPDLSVSQIEKALAGDQEQVEIDLPDVPPEVSRIAFVLYVNEGTAARRTLGQLRQLSVAVRDATDNRELVRSENLAPALSAETALVLAEVYRNRSDWKFKVVGEGYASGIAGIASDYGLPL
ncbi:TerD family protein [Blastococcus sp. CT_GayMR16]|uniref:TerD family protein n=1 Tax=Blastococcus sp. CT_GayMR16 TaxID=2559607 RepID=UPI001ADDB924|nr:TerD family protein [Blastococcus sp. CT_GayMR16]